MHLGVKRLSCPFCSKPQADVSTLGMNWSVSSSSLTSGSIDVLCHTLNFPKGLQNALLLRWRAPCSVAADVFQEEHGATHDSTSPSDGHRPPTQICPCGHDDRKQEGQPLPIRAAQLQRRASGCFFEEQQRGLAVRGGQVPFICVKYCTVGRSVRWKIGWKLLRGGSAR